MAVRPPIPELLKFLSPYDKEVIALALKTRAMVLKEAPDATETIYDAYSAVAIGYSFTGRLKEGFCHIAVYTGYVNLGFNRGVELPDPQRLMQGTGRWTRHVTIRHPEDLRRPYLRRLIRLAIENSRGIAAITGAPAVPPQSVVKGIFSRKRRPR